MPATFSTLQDETGAATPLPAVEPRVAAANAAKASAMVCVIALSGDQGLIEALTHAATPTLVVIASPSADRLVDQIVANAGSIVFIDAAAAPQPLDAFIATLCAQFPGIVLMVAGSGAVHKLLAPRVTDGSVFRMVHKPVSAQRLKLLLGAALTQRELPPVEEPSAIVPAHRNQPRSSGRIAALAGSALIQTALLALAGVRLHRQVVPASAPPVVPAVTTTMTTVPVMPKPSAAPAPSPQQVSSNSAVLVPVAPPASAGRMPASADLVLRQMLLNADSALAEGRLMAADGSAAGDLYQTALLRAPGNERAVQGLNAVVDRLLIEVDRALGGGRLEEAAEKLQAVRNLQPGNARSAELAAQLAALRESAEAPP